MKPCNYLMLNLNLLHHDDIIQRMSDVTIQADFTYAPNNVEPESAVELTDGLSYGPLSGFEGLDQYFFIDVPVGTRRLEVDLDNGDGEAKLMMRLEQYPTWTTYDYHSNAQVLEIKSDLMTQHQVVGTSC